MLAFKIMNDPFVGSLTFCRIYSGKLAKGASLDDPTGLFNSSLEGNTRRAIDFPEGAPIDAEAFQTLVKAAVALNESKSKR